MAAASKRKPSGRFKRPKFIGIRSNRLFGFLLRIISTPYCNSTVLELRLKRIKIGQHTRAIFAHSGALGL